jgi:hypothetical protein
VWAILAACWAASSPTFAQEFAIHSFQRQRLTDVYFSEGIAAGDLNRDGKADVVYGPYWFAGPTFAERFEIFPAQPQPVERYANHFFAWVHDFNGDGWNDVLTAGFPGTPAYVYENPHSEGHAKAWPKHEVLNSVCNESPQFVHIVGDERPEFVCTWDGFFGYATINWESPFQPWEFHAVSEKVAPVPFGHGLGVGDVNGDKRPDILAKDGWFEQPESAGRGRWVFHAAPFAPPGGADIHAYDVDGDGDNDVITSLAAHEFGLAWYEQVREGSEIAFKQHLIMGDQPRQNRYGVVFSELHSVNMADVDGDGLLDILTGKTYWSHHRQSPMWDAGAVVYWFRLVRGEQGVDFVPYMADGESGIGRQLIFHDINGDGLVDLAAGGMKGAHLLLHRREGVSEARWRAVQPKVMEFDDPPAAQGRPPEFNDSGRVNGGIEGESIRVVEATAGKTSVQDMAGFKAGRWSGNAQLFWTGATRGGRLRLEFEVPNDGNYEIAAALTRARDYAIVQPRLDDEPLGEPLDLYAYPNVESTGELTLGVRPLTAGRHQLVLEITGANPSAVRAYLVGLDYVRLISR